MQRVGLIIQAGIMRRSIPLARLKNWMKKKLTSRRGKFLATAMARVEVISLEILTFLDRTFFPGILRVILWMLGGSWGSIVVPLGKNINSSVQIAPTDEIYEIARRAHVIAVQRCYCRWRNQDYRYPMETCLVLGAANDLRELAHIKNIVSGTNSHTISNEKLHDILEDADRRGLIHQLIFFPSPQFFYVICNCAAESCTTLRNLIRWGTPDVVKSNFIQHTDSTRCTSCGICLTRCPFGARIIKNGKLFVNSNRCFGCGLCVHTCPHSAITLKKRDKK